MKLMLLLILGVLNLSLQRQCKIYDRISKSDYETTYSHDGGVYIDTYDFDGDDYIKIYVTAYNGYIEDSYIYYDGSNSEPQKNTYYDVYEYVSYDSYSYSSSYTYSYPYYYYNYYTYYYKIPKPSERYLLIAIPTYYGSSVEIGHSSGFAVWIIVVIVIVVIAIAVGIIIYFIIRKKAKSYVAPVPNPGYYPPVNAYATNPSPYTPPPAFVPSYPPAAPNYY